MPDPTERSGTGPLVDRITDQICDGVEPPWAELLAEHPELATEIERLRRVYEVDCAFRDARPQDTVDTQHPGQLPTPTNSTEDTDQGADPSHHWGPLRLLEPIGRGAFGTVWRARDPFLEREVALKLSDRASPRDRERILDEGRRLARITHPGVVRVHGAAVHDGRPGIWMDLAHGRTLDERLRQDGRFTEDEAIAVGRALGEALAAVHAAGVVHGDIKAANVLRRDGGTLLLGDFGSSLDSEDDEASGTRSASPIYAAPEVLRGEDPSPQSDLYSLGVLLYHLLTGSFPVEGDSVEQLLDAHRNGHAASVRNLRSEVSAGLAEIIDRALADPERRWRHAVDLCDALEALTTRPARSNRPTRSRWPAALLLVAAIATVWFVWRLLDGTPTPPAIDPVDRSAAVVAEEPAAGASPPATDPIAVQPAPLEAFRLGLFRRGVDTALASGDPIRVGDALHLRVTDSDRPLWLYIVNQDSEGQAYVLFPLAGVEPTNPLAPGDHRLPGAIDGVAQDWVVTSEGRTESFLFVASHEPLEQFERALRAIREASRSRHPDTDSFPFATRGVGGLSDAAPDQAHVLAALEQIAKTSNRPVRSERLTLVGG